MKIIKLFPAALRPMASLSYRQATRYVTVVVLMLLVSGIAQAADLLDQVISIDIPANTRLEDALIEWGTRSRMTVMINTKILENRVTKGVRGTLSARMALSTLLSDSDLTYTEVGGRVRVVPKGFLARSFQGDREAQPLQSESIGEGQVTALGGNAAEDYGNVDSGGMGDAEQGSSNTQSLEQVTVTAQKRSERLQDVPIPLTVLNTESLVETNQLTLEDYYSRVPGLNVVAGESPASPQVVSIRGITTGFGTNPTVGITIDDVPYGSATNLGGGTFFPNIDPSDLARMEVLRGPQGTLYGASSMGGLIKYVTVDPSTDALSGRVQAGVSGVHNGSDSGYNFRGSANVPVSDTVAIRASGYTREDPGYIDNPTLHVNGVNEGHDSGGRLAMLWRPSEVLSLKLSALYQSFYGDGTSESLPRLGDLQQDFIRGTGAYSGKTEAYSATLAAKVGDIDITSLTGYNIQQARESGDFTPSVGSLTQQLYLVNGAGLTTDEDTKKISQEIRASSSIGHVADWLFGVFYTHEKSSPVQDVFAINPDSGVAVADAYHESYPSTYSEYAVFVDLTVHVTDRFNIQVGARESQIRQIFAATETSEPLFLNGSTTLVPGAREDASSTPFTYLVTPKFNVSPDLMVYARAASGYRAGGPNIQACTVFNFPCQYAPDKTKDYDLGVKGEFFHRTLSFDAAFYYIDWRNIQVSATAAAPAPPFSYEANAAGAKSQGLELSVDAKPLSGLTVGAWVAWDDAELTKAFPTFASVSGSPGDRVPYTSRFSGNVSINQEFRITRNAIGFVGATESYVGDREGDFTASPSPRANLPAYAKTDVVAGLRYQSWTTNVFVNNLTDKRGILFVDTGTGGLVYIQPRTVGLNVSKAF
jgi:iron complex outermembrane recepter protein